VEKAMTEHPAPDKSDSMANDTALANECTRQAWEANAAFWDQRMGDGNDWMDLLVWPATLQLLGPCDGKAVLDIACGNGVSSRRLAELGAQVVAFDFSERMIELARQRGGAGKAAVRYLVLDATDQAGLLTLGRGAFDAALCNMALFDIADLRPLLGVLPRVLRPGGRFVFSVLHPCFNNDSLVQVAEQEDAGDRITTRYSVKISHYITTSTAPGIAMRGQPEPHLYFFRPLQELLGACFEAGFILDGLLEPTFPAEYQPATGPLSWGGNYAEIPPVLVARLRLVR
jgi:SAM-dependent methyltransferase